MVVICPAGYVGVWGVWSDLKVPLKLYNLLPGRRPLPGAGVQLSHIGLCQLFTT